MFPKKKGSMAKIMGRSPGVDPKVNIGESINITRRSSRYRNPMRNSNKQNYEITYKKNNDFP
jgi:hypothetical protein